jgi:hypothetical protein
MTKRRKADFTPTREYLTDLGDRLERISDGEENVPIGPGDIFVLRKALKTAIDIWRPEVTAEELIDG